jgi:putative transcriptional regulator
MSNTADGKILIATPRITGKIFHKSVVYIHTDNDTGAIGVMLNVPMDHEMAVKWSKELGWDYPDKIYLGGPVERRLGYVIHSNDYVQDTTIELNTDVSYTAGKSIMDDIQFGMGPSKFFLVTGYSAWQPGQLETEITNGMWTVADFDLDYFFQDHDRDTGWRHGIDIAARNTTNRLLDMVDSI